MANTAEGNPVGWAAILTRQYGPPLALVCMGVWLHAADSLLVATMLPAMIAEIGGEALVGWNVMLYQLGTILTGAASGLLALRHGVRLPMGAAALLFAAGCAISAIAPTMWIVLIGRLVQGIGGGGLMALSFVAVGVLFPRPLIPRAMGAVSGLWGLSAFLGPLVGGLFVEFLHWRGGFWFFALQALALSAWIGFGLKLEEKPAQGGKVDQVSIPRLVLLGAGVVMIAYGGIEVSPLRTAGSVLAGILCIVGFLALDSQSDGGRLLPRRPLSLATPAGSALVMIFCLTIATIAITAYGPLFIVRLHGGSALVAGYVAACASIGWTIAAVAVAGAAERHDLKLIALGILVVTVSVVGFVYSVPNGPIWLVAFFAAMEGMGFGMSWAFILRQTVALAPAGETERIAGSIPTVQRLGYAIGAAYVGIVANAAGFATADGLGALAEAARAVFLSCLPFAALSVAAMARFVFLAAKGRARTETASSRSEP